MYDPAHARSRNVQPIGGNFKPDVTLKTCLVNVCSFAGPCICRQNAFRRQGVRRQNTWYLPSFAEFTQPTFRYNLSVPNSRVKKCLFPSWVSSTLKMGGGLICCPGRWGRNYQPTPHKFPKRAQVPFTLRRKSRITPAEHVAVRGRENSGRVYHHTCIHVRKIRWKISAARKKRFAGKPNLTTSRNFEMLRICENMAVWSYRWGVLFGDNLRDAVRSGII